MPPGGTAAPLVATPGSEAAAGAAMVHCTQRGPLYVGSSSTQPQPLSLLQKETGPREAPPASTPGSLHASSAEMVHCTPRGPLYVGTAASSHQLAPTPLALLQTSGSTPRGQQPAVAPGSSSAADAAFIHLTPRGPLYVGGSSQQQEPQPFALLQTGSTSPADPPKAWPGSSSAAGGRVTKRRVGKCAR